MARKNSFTSRLNAATSLAASFTTAPTMVNYEDNIAYQINVTTSNSTGAFSVEASLDYSPGGPTENAAVSGNWVQLNLAGGNPTVAAANDSILVDLNQLPYKAVRLKYTAGTAGTGVCDIFLSARTLGG